MRALLLARLVMFAFAAAAATTTSNKYTSRLVHVEVFVNSELPVKESTQGSIVDQMSNAKELGASIRARYISLALLQEDMRTDVVIFSSSRKISSLAAFSFAAAFAIEQAGIPTVYRRTADEEAETQLLSQVSAHQHEVSVKYTGAPLSPAVRIHFTSGDVLRTLAQALDNGVKSDFLSTITLELWRVQDGFYVQIVTNDGANFADLARLPLLEFRVLIKEITGVHESDIDWQMEESAVYSWNEFRKDLAEMESSTSPVPPQSSLAFQASEVSLVFAFTVVLIALLFAILRILRHHHYQEPAYEKV